MSETTIRRRHRDSAARRSSVQPGSEDSSFVQKVKAFDVYARVDQDLGVKTESGAIVMIIFWILILLMVWAEVAAYLRGVPEREHLVVDATMGQKLRINLDMTFHAVPCLDLHLDAMDVAGENQMDIEHDMLKQRLNPSGKPIGEAFTELPSEGKAPLDVPSNYCGSCYGASNGCCNTCKEVGDAYGRKGWTAHDIRRTAEQCIRENHLEVPVEPGEGCRLSGFMLVNKVAGNFHMAAGEGVMRGGRHIHQYNMEEAQAFNVSHRIDHLSFGDPFPGTRHRSPLDGLERVVDEVVGTGLFQYFIKLVPTVHIVGGGDHEMTGQGGDRGRGAKTQGEGPGAGTGRGGMSQCQFAYTHRFRSIWGYTDYHLDESLPHHHKADGEVEGDEKESKQMQMLLPGIFFVYDVSPFMVEVSRAPSPPLSHLLIRLCAVAGGAFAVSGMLDSAIFYVSSRLNRHGLLG